MNGNRLSNLLVWWLVPSLFVVTASQCGSKKKMNSRGSANSASGSPGRGSETSSPSRKAEGDVDSDTIARSDDSERQRSLGAIRGLTDELNQLFTNGGYYERFLEKSAKEGKNSDENLNSNAIGLSSELWLGYYKPCSRIWMCLVQRGLVLLKGSVCQLNFGFFDPQGNSGILSHFAVLLLNRLSEENFMPYLVYEGEKSDKKIKY